MLSRQLDNANVAMQQAAEEWHAKGGIVGARSRDSSPVAAGAGKKRKRSVSPRHKKHRTFEMPSKTRRNFRTHMEILNSARQSLDDKGQFEWLKGAKVFGEDPRNPGRFPQEVHSGLPTEAALNRSTRSRTTL